MRDPDTGHYVNPDIILPTVRALALATAIFAR
jgi:hypothetical protein